MSATRIVFGYVVESAGPETPDEVLDVVESSGVTEAEWEWVVFTRRRRTSFLLLAPLAVRAALARSSLGSVETGVSIARRVTDNRNTFVFPSSGPDGPARRAEETVASWYDGLFRDPEPEASSDTDEPASPVAIPDIAKRRARIARGSSRASPRDEVLAAFSLKDAVDSAGRKFNLSTLSEPEDEG